MSIHSRFPATFFRALDHNIQRLTIRITIQLFLLNCKCYKYHNTVASFKAENSSIFGEKQNKIIVPTYIYIYSLILKK